MIVALSLSPSLDVTYEVATLQRGEITRPRRTTRVAGGKALNVARVAHALGADVHVVAALGGHTGAWIAEMLRGGVDGDGVALTVVPLAEPTRISSAIVEDGAHTSSTDLYEAATPLTPQEWAAFRDAVQAIDADDGAWFVVSGSLPVGVPPDELADLIALIRSRGARVAVDSSGAGLRALAGTADLLKVNRVEAGELLGAEQADARTAASTLHERYGWDAVVTDGIRGGFAVIGGTALDFAPPQSPGRFPAGSGDAFLGGLLAALHAGSGAGKALAYARDAAERNAAVAGQAVLAPRERID